MTFASPWFLAALVLVPLVLGDRFALTLQHAQQKERDVRRRRLRSIEVFDEIFCEDAVDVVGTDAGTIVIDGEDVELAGARQRQADDEAQDEAYMDEGVGMRLVHEPEG